MSENGLRLEELKQTTWHALDRDAALAQLKATRDGLSAAEARQRLDALGPNRLPTAQRQHALLRFLKHFHNVLIYILLAAALVTAALEHWIDTAVIAAVVVLNALIGFLQEGRAEKSLDAIRGMLSHTARVKRDGQVRDIAAEDVVVGDIVTLAPGARVPADVRLIAQRDLQIEEAVLTGESVASSKATDPAPRDAGLGDRECVAYSGTLVTYGSGTGVVFATGAHTQIGSINTMLGAVEQITTPLLRQVEKLGHFLSYIIVGIAGLTFLFGWLLRGYTPAEMLLNALGLAIAAIPEGLPAIMTITLAIGVRRMAGRNAIIRRLPAVDTLGSVTVICSDKTGTLTKNAMTATELRVGTRAVAINGTGYAPNGSFQHEGDVFAPEEDPALMALLRAGLFCTDAHIRESEGQFRAEGAPTEAAVVVAAAKAGLDREACIEAAPLIDSLPFSSEHKLSARLHQADDNTAEVLVLGAPDRVIARSTHAAGASAGARAPIDRAALTSEMEAMAARGLRVLAVAQKQLDARPTSLELADLEDLTVLGLIGIVDPPREEAIVAVKQCQEAGVRVVMITGDHALTALAIGKRLGLGGRAEPITGAELEAMDEAELKEAAGKTNVFARVSPEHKLRLVTALQQRGEVVAMTGDGVNDAPAIKRADVGIAMGITGTEVSKEASDMVLADDNFASIEQAVEEGRTVYDNIRKSVLFILPTNGGEALTILGAILLGAQLPLTPVQVLWVNMITAVTLALALAFEPPEGDIMRRPPRPPKSQILTPYFLWRIGYVSVLIGAATFGAFKLAILSGDSLAQAQTFAVNTLVACEAFYLIATRFIAAPSLTLAGLFGSRAVLISIALVTAAQAAYTYLPPLAWLFGATPISAAYMLYCGVAGVLLLLIVEVEKWGYRLYTRRSQAQSGGTATTEHQRTPAPC